jgi:tRNA(adenine34) deaminase
MKKAFKKLELAFEKGEGPVRLVVVLKDQFIGRSHNLTQQLNDITAHAEMQAISATGKFLNAKSVFR